MTDSSRLLPIPQSRAPAPGALRRRFSNAVIFLRRGAFSELWMPFWQRVYSNVGFTALHRDLGSSAQVEPPRIPLRIRQYMVGDECELLDVGARGLSAADVRACVSRRRLLAEGIGNCFVAVTETGRPCYIQWAIWPEESDRLRRFSDGFFPPVLSGEVLLEGAFTAPHARGHGVMGWAQAEIAIIAGRSGASHAWTYVADDNVASLKGSARAGFSPAAHQLECWRAFRHSIRSREPAGQDR